MQSLDFITQIMCKKVDIVLLKYCMYENRYHVPTFMEVLV
jgi:hypothetical protein